MPDYLIVTPRLAFCIEMKRSKGGKLSDEQVIWLTTLEGVGIPAYVAEGFDQAKKIVDSLI